jgi:hypothetical protein
VAGSAGAGPLGQVGLEGAAHIRPVEGGEVVKVGEVLGVGSGVAMSVPTIVGGGSRRRSTRERQVGAAAAAGDPAALVQGIPMVLSHVL